MARNSRKPLILRLAWVAVPVVALLCLIAFWYSGIQNNPLETPVYSSYESMPGDGRPAFLTTEDASIQVPPNASLKQRLLITYQKLQHKWGKKNPTAYTFPASPQPVGCLVEGLLDQCMRVKGTRYLIAREVLGTSVDFGFTNTLNGFQFVAAFEQTLRDNGLLLLTNKPGVVKIIPKNKLEDYRNAGLVKSNE
jgi:hypothetical protein